MALMQSNPSWAAKVKGVAASQKAQPAQQLGAGSQQTTSADKNKDHHRQRDGWAGDIHREVSNLTGEPQGGPGRCPLEMSPQLSGRSVGQIK